MEVDYNYLLKKHEIIRKLDEVLNELDSYLQDVKKRGGTMGYRVGSVFENIQKSRDFFDNEC
jgi:hypothetical protein